jgi:hypothetical protein
MRYAIILIPLLALLTACNGGEEQPRADAVPGRLGFAQKVHDERLVG